MRPWNKAGVLREPCSQGSLLSPGNETDAPSFHHQLQTKGRYTQGVLLPEHAPGSFCMCQYTRGSVFKFAQFAPGACSQIFNRLNIVEHFAGWNSAPEDEVYS